MSTPAEPEVGPTPSECPRPEDVARVERSTADTPWAYTPPSLNFRTSSGVTRDGKIDDLGRGRHSGENRSLDDLELFKKTGFRLSPE
jgi:hypothetical protein